MNTGKGGSGGGGERKREIRRMERLTMLDTMRPSTSEPLPLQTIITIPAQMIKLIQTCMSDD